MIISAILLD